MNTTTSVTIHSGERSQTLSLEAAAARLVYELTPAEWAELKARMDGKCVACAERLGIDALNYADDEWQPGESREEFSHCREHLEEMFADR